MAKMKTDLKPEFDNKAPAEEISPAMAKMKTDLKPPALQRRFYGIKDAAHYLGVSEQFLYNGTARKSKKPLQIPFRRIGGKLLFDIKELERF